MLLLAIPSENCPYCRKKGGTCSALVSEVGTFQTAELKQDEISFTDEIMGKKDRKYREAYSLHKIVCLKGKGK